MTMMRGDGEARRVKHSSPLLTPAGLRHDRGSLIVSEEDVFRPQRRHPRLAVIRPEITTAARGSHPARPATTR